MKVHGHHDEAHQGPGPGAGRSAKDPVCGMQVDPAHSAASCEYEGTTYHFSAATVVTINSKPTHGYSAGARRRHPFPKSWRNQKLPRCRLSTPATAVFPRLEWRGLTDGEHIFVELDGDEQYPKLAFFRNMLPADFDTGYG